MTKNLHPQYDLDDENSMLRIDRPGGSCLCGCGQATGLTSKFRQGHDQRYRGALLHAYRNSLSIGVIDGGMLVDTEPQILAHNDAVEMVFTGGKVAGIVKTQESRPSEQAMAAVEQDEVASLAADLATQSDQRTSLIGVNIDHKVGRWTYKCEVVSYELALDSYTLEYTTKGKNPEAKRILVSATALGQ